MKIGFSYWGFCEHYKYSNIIDTPDGGRFTRPIFAKELLRRNHEIFCLQKQREQNPVKELKFSLDYPNIDLLFIEWRWPTYKNYINHEKYHKDNYEPDLDRQKALLDYYYGKIPIIVWDTDLKVTKEDYEKYPNVIWTEPTFPNYKKFHEFSIAQIPYFTDFNSLFPVRNHENLYTYIGSNYERYYAVDKYYYELGKELKDNNIDIQFFGNWLQTSPERPEQEEQIRKYKEVINFNGRNKFLDGMEQINKSITTTHIVKQLYCKHGLITPRFFESLANNTPALIQEEFPIQIYGDTYKVTSDNIFEKIIKLSKLNSKQRNTEIIKQINHLKNNFPECNIKNVIDKIENLSKL